MGVIPPPPPGPPPDPGGGTPEQAPAQGGRALTGRQWAAIGVAAVAAVVLIVVLMSGGGGGEKSEAVPREVMLVSAAAPGPDPFTPPVDPADPVEAAAVVGAQPVSGVAPAAGAPLYGGSGDNRVCDVEALARFLEQNPAKARAWADVLGISADSVGYYVRTSLWPSVLLYDTRVTNHGFANGRATPLQAVLQAGTAVLVDFTGQPRVKCKCGNPLTPPVATVAKPEYTGDPWPGFDPGVAVTVAEPKPDDLIPPTSAPADPSAAEEIHPEQRVRGPIQGCTGLDGGPWGGSAATVALQYDVKPTGEPGVYAVTVTFPPGEQERQQGPWTFTVDTTEDRWPAKATNAAAKRFAGSCILVEQPGGQWFSNLKAVKPGVPRQSTATTAPTADPDAAIAILREAIDSCVERMAGDIDEDFFATFAAVPAAGPGLFTVTVTNQDGETAQWTVNVDTGDVTPADPAAALVGEYCPELA
jgi:hypothetical protein